MNMLVITIEILATILEGYIGIMSAGLVLESRYGNRKQRLYALTVSAFLSVFVTLLNKAALFSYVTIAFGIISISASVYFLYRCKYVHAFMVICFYFMCMNYLDFLAITITGAVLQYPDYSRAVVTEYGFLRIRQMLICKGLLAAAYLCARHFIKGKFRPDSWKHYMMLTIAGGIGIIYLIESSIEQVNDTDVVNWLVFSIIILLSWILVIFYEKSRHEADMVRFMEMRNALLEENYRGLSEAYSANAKVYHDFNNHIHILHQYLMHEDTKHALEYLEHISGPVKSLLEHTWTGNEVVDVIINSKLKKMEENRIQTRINVEFPNNSDIMPGDICTILGNLLDNAIEACQRNKKQENKWIHITIRIVNAMLIFKIENGNEKAPQIRNKQMVTSKGDERFHGWGIKSAASAVEKYEGVMQHTAEEDRMAAVVTLNYNVCGQTITAGNAHPDKGKESVPEKAG